MCVGVRPDRSALEAVGDHLRLPGLSVPRGPADVRRQHDVGHARQRMVGGQPFADEVVQAGGGRPCRLRRASTRASVSCSWALRGVEEDHAVAHGCELLGADHPDGLVGDRRVQRDDVGLGEQLVKAVARLVVVRVVAR